MKVSELKEVLELLKKSSDNAEDMYCKYNNSEYWFEQTYAEEYIQDANTMCGSYSYVLIKDGVLTDLVITQKTVKHGSFFIDREECEEIELAL